jgi:transketolase
MYSGKISDPQELRNLSREIRKSIVKSLANAGSGHLGGSLGLADVFVCLYFNVLNHDPGNPSWAERDRLILSIGHVAPVLYATLAHAGYFPVEELESLRKMGSRLQGHPGRDLGLPGIELSAGSLGQGLSVAVGRALAGKMEKRSWRIYSIHGDGELQEGSIWEAAMSASHYKLGNLTSIIDRNSLQIDGPTEKVMQLEPLALKWRAFGWNVIECNGHDHMEIIKCCKEARNCSDKPSVIIARTIMGKGIKEIENDHRWHGKAPTIEEAHLFLEQLK